MDTIEKCCILLDTYSTMVDWHETRRSWVSYQFLYFLLSLETLILFALTLPLLLLSFFFSPWWPLLKTQPFKLFVLVELRSHITYSK